MSVEFTRPCSAEQMALCPLSLHYMDNHHLAHPRRDYNKGIEKAWRELPINKVLVCRGLHNAIHAAGYIPDKPLRAEMAAEIWDNAITERSLDELEYQLSLGQRIMEEGAA